MLTIKKGKIRNYNTSENASCLPRIISAVVRILFFAFFYHIQISYSFALEPVIIDKSLKNRVIGRYLEYMEDKSKIISYENIISDGKTGNLKWIRSEKDKLSFGFIKAVYWVRFSFKNPTDTDIEFYLLQDYPHVDYLDLYIPDRGGKYRIIKTGAVFPFAQRPVEYRNFIFPITIKARAEETLYLRSDSKGSMNIDLSAFSPEAFERHRENEAIFFWIFSGISLVMIIFNLFIFFAIRDLGYLYYIMYIASFGLFTMSLNGMAYQYLWPGYDQIGKLPIAIAMALTIISIVEFALNFLNIKILSRNWIIIMRTITALSVLLLLIMIITRNYFFAINSVNILTGAAVSVGVIMLGYIAIVKKSRQARIILSSYLLFFIGVFMVVLMHRGILASTIVTNNGIYIGAIFQYISLSLGLADKINGMKNELKILNQNLGKMVDERTKELTHMNEEMTAINENLIKTRDALWAEMQLAKKIQTKLLPMKPAIDGYDISVYMKPADNIGGDYYDIINAGGMDWIIIGDVSGRGVPAGLIMMMAQTSINTIIESHPDMPPSSVLIKANKTIYHNIQRLGENKYMTIIALAAHKGGRFVFSGILQDIMIYRANTNAVDLIGTDGLWIGIKDDLSGSLSDGSFNIGSGDTILLYTDGIIKARERVSVKNDDYASAWMFGTDRLKNIFKDLGRRSLDEIKYGILDSLKNYNCSDDVTLMLFRRMS